MFNYALKDEERKAISSVVGIDCYFENDEVNALVKDGKLIYQDGDWKDGFKDRTVTVATNEYVGTSDDVFKDAHNPLVRFTESDRLIEQDQIDVDCAVDVLTREAAENNGLLTIDTMPHFIEGRYHDPDLHTPNTADGSPAELWNMLLMAIAGMTAIVMIAAAGKKLSLR